MSHRKINLMQLLVATVVTFAAVVGSASAVVAGGMVANHQYLPGTSGSIQAIDAYIQVADEPGDNGRTFWANQFSIADGDGGYTGIQQSRGTEKRVIFSIWQALGGTPGPGMECTSYSHEGSGISCGGAFAWTEGTNYKFRVEQRPAVASGSVWRSTVINMTTGASNVIGEIVVPTSWNKLEYTLVQFVENYAQGSTQLSSCSAAAPNTAIFRRASADGASARWARTKTYGNCASIASSICTPQYDCTALINSAVSSGSSTTGFMLNNPASNLCAYPIASALNVGLYGCTAKNSQMWKTDSSGRLLLKSIHKCAQPSWNGNQVVGGCTLSSNRQWVYMPNTGRYLNVGRNQCLATSSTVSTGSFVRLATCASHATQNWSRTTTP